MLAASGTAPLDGDVEGDCDEGAGDEVRDDDDDAFGLGLAVGAGVRCADREDSVGRVLGSSFGAGLGLTPAVGRRQGSSRGFLAQCRR